MKYSFGELKAYYAAKRGFSTFASMDSQLQVAAIAQMNQLYNGIWYFKQYGFSGDKFQGTFVAPVASTVSGTLGERIITFGSSIQASYYGVATVGQFVSINGRLYRLLYRRSATVWTIDRSLPETIASGTACTIYFVNYPCPIDLGAIRSVTRGTDMIPYVAELVTPNDNNAGTPDFAFNAGRTKADFLNTGTVTTVANSNRLTYSTTASTEWIGMTILLKVSNAYEYFKIVDVDTGSNYIYLDRPFSGTGASGISIVINPAGLQQIGFKDFPNAADIFEVSYTFAPNKLQYDTDLTMLPTDTPMLAGIELLGTKWETVGEGNINEVVFQDKKFRESLKVLNLRGTPLQNRLYSQAELRNMKQFPRNTNPWNRG